MFGKFKFVVLTKKRAITGVVLFFVGIAFCSAIMAFSKNPEGAERIIPIYSVDCAEKKIAITFDCAWGDEDTDEILKALEENDVKATFFVTGDYVRRCSESVKKFSAANHDIANHSDDHPHPNNISKEDLIEDTKKCSREIERLGIEEKKLYRAPYGEYNNQVVQTINSMGYSFIQWDADSLDYRGITPNEMEKRITDKIENGSIVLFHTGTNNTASALRQILPRLKDDGYSFVLVDDLIYKDNFFIDHSGKQIKTK